MLSASPPDAVLCCRKALESPSNQQRHRLGLFSLVHLPPVWAWRARTPPRPRMSLHRSSRHSLGSSSSRHSTISVGGTRYSSRGGPPTVHAASLLSLQLWAISELRNVLPPLGERVRAARLAFLGVVAALAAAMVLSYPLGAVARYVGSGSSFQLGDEPAP